MKCVHIDEEPVERLVNDVLLNLVDIEAMDAATSAQDQSGDA
jgi:hypothetical protein